MSGRGAPVIAGAFAVWWGVSAIAAERGPSDSGLSDLIARVGAGNEPTGADVSVGHVEVADAGNYGPDQASSQYVGILFHEQSGPTGTSAHGQQVGRRFYGNPSISPGIDEVYLYEVNHWIGSGYLRAGTGSDPVITPGNVKVFNHSWVGASTENDENNEILRRIDFAARRDDILMVVGVNNEGGANLPLLSHNYNGLSVGLLLGVHQSGNTLAGIDGPGRLKPEIVADEDRTSYATPFVAGAVTLMTETARTEFRGTNPLAERGETIKAILLAGAEKPGGWTNNAPTGGPSRGSTAQPIDTIFGAGRLDVNLAHLIMTGGEQDGGAAVPGLPNISSNGWDFEILDNDESRYYRFRIYETADVISVAMTWHRRIFAGFGGFSVADFELRLWRIDSNGQLVSLIGPGGVGVFADGNVYSNSSVDNIEHLYITGLEPCDYVMEMKRIDELTGPLNWDVAIAWRMPDPPACPADIDGSNGGEVDVFDLFVMLDAWGECSAACPPACTADLTGDGNVDVFDLFELLEAWGPCP